MSEKKKEYKRLPGSGFKRGSFFTLLGIRASMWLGKDHLLCMYSSGLSEDYKRFYYSDIQAIVTQKTSGYKIYGFILLIFSLLLIALSVALKGTPAIIFLIIAALFFAFLIVHLLRGPTCSSHLYTAVSKEELPSLNRLRNAVKSLGNIIPRIEEAQGGLRPEELKARSEEIAAHAREGIKAGTSPAKTAGATKSYSGKFHILLFSVLLLGGFLETADFFISNIALPVLSTVTSWVLAVFVIIALIQQHGSAMGKGLRSLTWITLAYMILSYFAGTAIYTVLFFKYPESMGNQLEMMKMAAELSPFDDPFLLGYYIFSINFSFVASISGLVLSKKFRSKTHPPSATPRV